MNHYSPFPHPKWLVVFLVLWMAAAVISPYVPGWLGQ